MNIEQQENGKFKYREKYKHPLTNKWKSVTVTYEKHNRHIEKLARKELDRKIKKKLEKIKSCNKDYTVKQVADMYLEDMKGVLKYDSTYPIRVNIIYRIVKLLGQDTLVNNLSGAYLNTQLENNHSKTYCKILLNWCYKKEFTERKLADLIVKSRKEVTYEDFKKSEEKQEYYERDELNELFEKLSNSKRYNDKMLRYILEMEVLTGKRWSECVAICEDDIDDDEMLLTVNKRAYRGSINTPKTETSIGVLGINSRVIQIKKEAIFLKRIYGIESEFLFTNKKGEPFIYASAQLCLKNLGYSPKTHMFRKTTASLLAENDVPLNYIQDRLGHGSDETTTKIYIKVTEKKKKENQDFFKNQKIL